MIESTGTDSALGDSVVRITDQVTIAQYIVGENDKRYRTSQDKSHSGVTCIN